MIHLSLPHLQHSNVVVTLGVVMVRSQRQFEALVGEVDISDAEGEVSHVVPHLGHRVGLLGGVQGALGNMS